MCGGRQGTFEPPSATPPPPHSTHLSVSLILGDYSLSCGRVAADMIYSQVMVLDHRCAWHVFNAIKLRVLLFLLIYPANSKNTSINLLAMLSAHVTATQLPLLR